MASPGQSGPSVFDILDKLREGVGPWNQWRSQNPNVPLVFLRGTSLPNRDFSNYDFSGADFQGTVMAGARLNGADLKGANLNQATLKGADLSNADLSDTNLQVVSDLRAATLQNANLKGANLQRVDFKDVDLLQADLREADLQGADLSTAKPGLRPWQLAGTDVTDTKLPEALKNLYEKMGSVSDISDSAKKLFLALLAACLYSWLTIGTTKDVDLITNRASSPLPIIQTAIPIVGFYVIAPIILLCVYFYFHFYLQKLWEELAQLPAIFPDGKQLHERADPWLFNDLVRAHFSRLKKDRPLLSYFQQWLSILLAWWLVPVTLFFFWGRYLACHDQRWSTVLAVVFALSVASATQLQRLTKETLRGYERPKFSWGNAVSRSRTYVDLLRALILVAASILISVGAINGDRVWDPHQTNAYRSRRTWIPRFTAMMGYPPFATLAYEDVSTKPADWTDKNEAELDRVKGANLIGRDLRYADAQHAFMINAQLNRANFAGANLTFADLRRASAWVNNLPIDNTPPINFDDATLIRADLRRAYFNQVSMRHAKLFSADLQQAQFINATLEDSNLTEANLEQTNLRGANLRRTNFTDAILNKAELGAADLTGADLSGAEIEYADFRSATGLTVEQIASASAWKMAFLDEDMLTKLGLPRYHNAIVQEFQESGCKDFRAFETKWMRWDKSRPTVKPKLKCK